MLTGYQGRFQVVSFSFFMGLAVTLCLGSISAGGEKNTPKELSKRPHGDAQMCGACHVSEQGEPTTLLYDGDIMVLCQSCHDGEKASQEVHPVDVSGESLADRMPSDFPLKDGRLTCLTCHDMAKACEADAADSFYLRGKVESKRVAFCAHCHDTAQTRPFNVHDQMDGNGLKTDTCLWCHVGQWKTDTPGHENPVYLLRPHGADLCKNCHTVASDHPSGGPHMNALVSEDMTWYMAATEMQAKMRLPFKDLLIFVKAAKRHPRTMPLNLQSRILCYTCHNPHETGVIKKSNPRALGAEPKQARNHRLRASKKGQMCQACHNI